MGSATTVLIVDDVGEMRSLLKQSLRMFGITLTQEAQDARRAVKLFQKHPTDAVFLDINLPDDSGLEVLKKLKAIKKDVKVIMVSGESSLDNVVAAMGGGADGFIVKPYSQEKIEETVARIRIDSE